MIQPRSLLVVLLITTGLGLTTRSASGGQAASETMASDEEYPIYSTVIKELYVQKDTKLVMIEERTFRYDFSAGDDQPWRDKPKGLPIDESAVQDYESKNRGQTVLSKAAF